VDKDKVDEVEESFGRTEEVQTIDDKRSPQENLTNIWIR
jgi:hypothetical protein